MFKNLKKKLEQGVAQSKAAVSGLTTTKGDDTFDKSASSEFIGNPLAESTPQKDGSQVTSTFQDISSPVVTTGYKFQGVSRVPTGQLVDIPLSEGFDSTHYETASDRSSIQGDETPRGLRSRTSSISSLTSDSSFFPSVGYSHSYYVPSDAESEIEETSVNLSAVSKEDLYAFVKRVERRAFKYKSKFMELAAAYKDMMQEREKLKMTMAQCQDRAFRRMSELREQIQLDQIAKRDLEENFRLLLDEKDEYMKILQLQVKLLKDGKEIPEELQANLVTKQAKAEATPPTAGGDNKGNISTNEEIELLKSKIKRQDALLQKCKETITSYKEKVSQLSLDKQELLGKLELKSKASESSGNQTSDQVSKLQGQIQEARKVIEQLDSDKEIQVAAVKQQVHDELEQLRGQHQTLSAENNSLKIEAEKLVEEVENLRKTNQEQLEKARSIMKQLKDDKQLALEQAEERIRLSEKNIEEKEKIISDLSRDKTEAFSVLQQESDKNLIEKVQEAVEERDRYWNIKMAAQEEAQNEMLQCKDKENMMALTVMQEEMSQKLKEKDEEIRLAIEERELHKMTNVTSHNEQKDELQLKIEELNSEKIELSNRFAKLQEDLENQVLGLREKLKEEEADHGRLIEELKLNYLADLSSEKSSLSEKTAEEVELLKQSHALEIQTLLEKQELCLQELNTNTESHYKTQMEDIKGNLENLLSVTKDQLEEMRTSFNQAEAKQADTQQLLDTAQAELDRRKKEQESQLEELYASINGKGDENEGLKRVIEEIRSQLKDRDKQLDESVLWLSQAQEETFRLREQVEETQGESKTKLEELFSEREDLIQKNQILTTKENSSNSSIRTLQESNLELGNQNKILFEELKCVRDELAASVNNIWCLQTEKCQVEEEFQRRLIHSKEEREQINSQALHVLEEQLKQLSEEHDCLLRNAEINKARIEELETHIDEISKEKETIGSKTQEFELHVNQLQEAIKDLESQKSTVEMEKSSLEEKLTDFEIVIADLKTSREVQYVTLIQQQAIEQQTYELRITDLSSHTDALNETIESLGIELSTKNDEIMALQSTADNSDSVVKSLECKINQLTVELQNKAQQNDHIDATLAENVEQFEQFKNETTTEVKELKDLIDSLTEKLNQKQQECEEMRNSFVLEKDSLIKQHDKQIGDLGEEIKAIEQTLQQQLVAKQAEFKDMVTQLKEDFRNKLQEKDTDFENRMKELMSQKDLSNEDLNKNLEMLKEEQLRNQEQKYMAEIDEIVKEWQGKYQTLDDEHRQNLEIVRSQLQGNIHDLQQKLDISLEESMSLKNDYAFIQSELEGYRLQLTTSEKHREDIENLNLQLKKKDDQLFEQKVQLETFHLDMMSEIHCNEDLVSQINSLTEQLHEKETKLESIASTMSTEYDQLCRQVIHQTEIAEELQAQKNIISEQFKEIVEKHKKEIQEKENLMIQINSLSEQLQEKENNLESVAREEEHLHKQLTQQMEITEELQTLKNDLSKQLLDIIEKHSVDIQEKDIVLNDVCQKLQLLEVEHASVEEMLRVNDASNVTETVDGSLRENIERLIAEKDSVLHNLETNVKNVMVLQEELQSLKDNKDQMVSDLIGNHAKEVDLLKSNYESQISQLSSNDAELQSKKHNLETQLTELNEKLQESIENYETRLEEERSKLVRQEISLKEQINVLKQQLYEAQSQAEVSSNKLQLSLQQKVKDGEEKLLTQLQSHQEDMETLKQETEQKSKDLKQKYIAKLREIQSQAKNTAEELQRNLQTEKAAKEEIYTDLSKANKHIQQLEEDSEKSMQRIIDLENTISEITALMETKDGELHKLKLHMAALEKNTENVLRDSQLNLQQINDKLIDAESRLKEKESDLYSINQQLQEKLLFLEEKNSEIIALQGRFQELEETCIQEKEKHEHEVQEKDKKCFELEDNIEKMCKLLAESENTHAGFEERVQSSILELERVQGEKQQCQDELAQLSAEKKELESELLDTKTLLARSLEEHASVLRELESSLGDEASQKEQIKQESEKQLRKIQEEFTAELAENKSLNEQIKQDYEVKLNELHQTHASELAELSTNVEAQSSSKVAEYKRKAEAFISQMKKQLQDEKVASFDKQQEKITHLEDYILVLTNEKDELKQSKETFIAENDRIIQNMKSELDVEVKLKQTVIEESYQKETEFGKTELELKGQIDLLLSEKNLILEKLSVIEQGGDNLKVQYVTEIEQLQAKNGQLQKDLHSMKSDKDEELVALETKLAETVQTFQKELHTALEEQANEHSSKVKILVKEMSSQLAVKEKEFDATFREVLEKSERNEQDMMREHHEDLNELRKEISERDERIQELHVEYKTKIQELMLQNQDALSAFQKSASVGDSLSQQQVVPPTAHINKLEETTSRQETELSALPKPLVAVPVRQMLDVSDPNFSLEMQDLELNNIDLQAQVSHLNGELSHYKVKERDLLKRIDKLERAGKGISEDDDPTASMDGLYLNHTDSAIFREPTEFEYLKNILYEYMMGKETKTLAKVIATVVRFSEEQTRNVVARSDTKLI